MPSHCIIVFDISTYIHRAFHSLPIEKFKRSHDNLATNAVYGTAKMLINTLQTIKWDYINIYPIICFDTSKSKLFRTAIDSDYKSNRPSAPSQLKHQFQWIRTLIHSMKLTNIEMPSCEADDLIASIVYKYKDNNDTDIIIVSNDKDMNQLVIQDNIKIFNPANKKYIKSDDIFDRYKVIPAHFTLYQALVGDRIDNIKGIKGIGPKTAPSIIECCNGSITNLPKSHPKYDIIFSNLDSLNTSLQLVTLNSSINIPLPNLTPFNIKQINNHDFKQFMTELEFFSLIKQFCKNFS